MINKSEVILNLKSQKLTLGCVESITGGAFASSVVDVPGVSSVFKGGVITYSEQLKKDLVKVSSNTITRYGVVSSRCAMDMAKGGQARLSVDYCLSFTGNAGPTVQDNKAVGDVYIAIAYNDQIIVEFFQFKGGRAKIRKQVVEKGWELLERVLKSQIPDYL